MYEPTFERAQRLRAMRRWAEVGVIERRAPLPIEQAFADRVAVKSDTFFMPVALNNLDEVDFHRELSYLVDAFDCLPARVDQAFDSTWKAFELETAPFQGRRITDRLETASERIHSTIVAELCSGVPVQTCEYAYKRLVDDFLAEKIEDGLRSRATRRTTPQILELLSYLRETYGSSGSSDARRKGSLLLRRALRGEQLVLGDSADFRLDDTSRSRFLVLLILYTARNERFHGSSFSPFVSSDASLRTYTHPFFMFVASYYLLLDLWLETRPGATDLSREALIESLRRNLNVANDIFGAHWNR